MFRIEMLPAAHGDCLWIEYGKKEEVQRILIDGGPAHTYPALRERILHLPADQRRFDLLVVTHVDADHIEGIVRLLLDAEALDCAFDRIWFNGRDQLNKVPDPAGEPLGAIQGEYLGLLIAAYEARTGDRVWNLGFADGLAAIDRASGRLPMVTLPGDCRLTILSPDHEQLLLLKDRWADELRKARIQPGDEDALRRRLEDNRQLRPLGDVLGASDEDQDMEGRFETPDPEGRDLAGGPADALGGDAGEPGADAKFGSDTSIANGSSIAFLLEYPGDSPEVRFLLTGDAWAPVLEVSIDALSRERDTGLTVDGFKIPHHGSVANLTESLLDKIKCASYLVSTSGARFRHPHSRAIDLLLEHHRHRVAPCLYFNYLTETTEPWRDGGKASGLKYTTVHPKGVSIQM